MIYGVLLALLAAVMWTGNAWSYTMVAKRNVEVIPFFALASAFGALACFGLVDWRAPLQGQTLPELAWPLTVTVFSGITNALAVVCQIRAFVLGHKGISWTIAQMAMVISFLAGVVLWHEPVHWVQYAGLVAVIGAVVLFMPRSQEPAATVPVRVSGKWLIYLLIAFISAGTAQVFYIVPSRYSVQIPSSIRAGLILVIGAVLAGVIALILRQPFRRSMVSPALLQGGCTVVGLVLTAKSGNVLATYHLAGLVYLISTVGTVMLFTLISRFVLKERFQPATWIALALGIAGLVLLSVH